MSLVQDLANFVDENYGDEVSKQIKAYVDHMETYQGSVSPRDFRIFLQSVAKGEAQVPAGPAKDLPKIDSDSKDFVSTKTIKQEESVKVSDKS